MIIDFSSLGSGECKGVDLCGDCRYFLRISYRDRVPQISWLSGTQIMDQFSNQDVKITVRSINPCARHAASAKYMREAAAGGTKGDTRFLNRALRSGVDINAAVDDYRSVIKRL